LIDLLIAATVEDKAPLAICYLRQVASGRTFDQLKSSNWQSAVTLHCVVADCFTHVTLTAL